MAFGWPLAVGFLPLARKSDKICEICGSFGMSGNNFLPKTLFNAYIYN